VVVAEGLVEGRDLLDRAHQQIVIVQGEAQPQAVVPTIAVDLQGLLQELKAKEAISAGQAMHPEEISRLVSVKNALKKTKSAKGLASMISWINLRASYN
jgi:hypothetical protein